jgi:hypothetical protein
MIEESCAFDLLNTIRTPIYGFIAILYIRPKAGSFRNTFLFNLYDPLEGDIITIFLPYNEKTGHLPNTTWLSYLFLESGLSTIMLGFSLQVLR